MKQKSIVLLICLFLSLTHLAAQDVSLRESLKETEIAFAKSVADQDFEKFQSFLAEEAIFMSGRPLKGKAAISAAWKGFFEPNSPKLIWKPEMVEVQSSGKLGITRGPFQLLTTTPEGEISETQGTFMSVWQRQAGGTWKVIFDSGCECAQP